MDRDSASIEVEIYSRVDSVDQSGCDELLARTKIALPLCLENPGPGECDLLRLNRIEITIVDDQTIGQVHAQFLDDPSPTDVITFQHGEILVSHETAKREAAARNHGEMDEVFLYIVHGVLHLNGHLDKDPADQKRMHDIQNSIWQQVVTE